MNALQIIQRRTGDDRQVQRAVQLGERQVRHTARLLDDLLDVSRIVLGKIQLRGEPVDLRDIVRRVASAARFGVQSQLLVLKIELPGEPLVVHGDPTRLEQCVGNLLSNAMKYTPPGGTIALSAHEEGDSAVIRVRDSGVGIAPEMLEQIFDLFAQADTSLARARGGLGIGLTPARRLVELHGGVLTARSEGLGRGSEFEIRLRTHHVAGPLPPPPPAAPPLVRRRVLVVEDNRDHRRRRRRVGDPAGGRVGPGRGLDRHRAAGDGRVRDRAADPGPGGHARATDRPDRVQRRADAAAGCRGRLRGAPREARPPDEIERLLAAR